MHNLTGYMSANGACEFQNTEADHLFRCSWLGVRCAVDAGLVGFRLKVFDSSPHEQARNQMQGDASTGGGLVAPNHATGSVAARERHTPGFEYPARTQTDRQRKVNAVTDGAKRFLEERVKWLKADLREGDVRVLELEGDLQRMLA